jgi:AcrR family transcriptional regulator
MPVYELQRLPRKKRERNLHRLEVLGAAEKLFASKGFHGTSMQDIAEAAEFSVGKLYTLFECKEDIYAKLMDIRGEEIYALTKEAHSGKGTAWDKIKRNLTALLEFVDSHKELINIFIYQTVGFPSKLRSGISEGFYGHYLSTRDCIRRTFQEGVIAGEFIDVDAEDLILALEGIFQMFCMHGMTTHPESKLISLADRILKVFSSQIVNDPDR